MSRYSTKLKREYIGLTRNFKVNPISCDNPTHYEDYLKLHAFGDQNIGRGVTYLFIDKDDKSSSEKIIGYVTLKASSFIKVYNDYKEGHSALEITELAVDRDWEGKGVGTDLVNYAINKALELNENHIGIEYIVLCSDPKAEGFYKKLNLNFIKSDDYYEVPTEGWNRNCAPMFLKLFY